MSGICGYIHFGERPVRPGALEAMSTAAAHRGPDGIRHWTGDDVGLAHLALHVTPEEARETQPLTDGALVLVADARIDNRAELRKTVRAQLRTPDPTDAELILASYRRWGTECATHLIGDFAFALWDTRTRTLVAARDPMGMRGFYYRAEPDRFLFGTEVQQLLAAPGVPNRPYNPTLRAYLAGDFEDVEHTFYEGIQALPPAHVLTVGATTSLRVRRVWDIDPHHRISYRHEQEYVDHFRALFLDAVRARLHTLKPVGLLLSGGVDSTAVAIAAGWLREQGEAVAPLRTYSFGYSTLSQCDERWISDPIVERFGLSSTVLDVERIPLVARTPEPNLDQPYVSAFHHLLLEGYEEAQTEGCGTMLSGHHGDLMVGGELFDYPGLFWAGQWRALAHNLQAHATAYGQSRRQVVREELLQPLRAQIGALWRRNGAGGPVGERNNPSWVIPARPETSSASHRSASVLAALSPMRAERYRFATLGGHIQGSTRNEFDCARRQLASADPWSDRRLFEFVMAVPPNILCREGENKWIARRALSTLMGGVGAQKIAPEPLYRRALKHTERTTILGLLESSRLDALGMAENTALRAYYDAYLRGTAVDHRFWFTLVLERWLRQRQS